MKKATTSTSKKAVTSTATKVATKKAATSKPKQQAEGFENAIVVDKFPSGRDLVQIRKINLKGVAYVDIRKFYLGEDGEPLPGKGVCLKAEFADRLIAALEQFVNA